MFHVHAEEQFDDIWNRMRRVLRNLKIRDPQGNPYKLSAILQENQEYDPHKIHELMMRASGEHLWTELCTYKTPSESVYVTRTSHPSRRAGQRYTTFEWNIEKLADDLFEAIFQDRLHYTTSLLRNRGV